MGFQLEQGCFCDSGIFFVGCLRLLEMGGVIIVCTSQPLHSNLKCLALCGVRTLSHHLKAMDNLKNRKHLCNSPTPSPCCCSTTLYGSISSFSPLVVPYVACPCKCSPQFLVYLKSCLLLMMLTFNYAIFS